MKKSEKIIENDLREIADTALPWEKLSGGTVLITGAGGMIASYLVYTLLYLNETRNLNIRVAGLVRNREKAARRFAPLAGRNDFSLIIRDVCEPGDIPGDADYIIHAASNVSPLRFTEDPVGTIRANTAGTANMLELAREKRSKRFMLLSTREIYGFQPDGKEYAGEDDYGVTDPAAVRSCYPESKRLAETLCSAYAAQYGVNTKIARIAHTYGPGIALGDGRVVGDFLLNVLRGEDIVLHSAGKAVLSLTYLSDLISGLFRVLLLGENPIYNVSTMEKESILTVGELAEKLAELFPEKHIGVRFEEIPAERKAGYLPHRVALLDSGKLYREGWKPGVGINDGFHRTADYYEAKVKEGEVCLP